MCGIVGYVGQHNASEIIVEGLRRLEYRGYDSAGLVVLDGGRLTIHRRPGKIADLAALLEREPATGGIGLGHTRWATHGAPSESNSHPHADCSGSLAVVHNGIIENYLSLKQRLLQAGHVFRSPIPRSSRTCWSSTWPRAATSWRPCDARCVSCGGPTPSVSSPPPRRTG